MDSLTKLNEDSHRLIGRIKIVHGTMTTDSKPLGGRMVDASGKEMLPFASGTTVYRFDAKPPGYKIESVSLSDSTPLVTQEWFDGKETKMSTYITPGKEGKDTYPGSGNIDKGAGQPFGPLSFGFLFRFDSIEKVTEGQKNLTVRTESHPAVGEVDRVSGIDIQGVDHSFAVSRKYPGFVVAWSTASRHKTPGSDAPWVSATSGEVTEIQVLNGIPFPKSAKYTYSAGAEGAAPATGMVNTVKFSDIKINQGEDLVKFGFRPDSSIANMITGRQQKVLKDGTLEDAGMLGPTNVKSSTLTNFLFMGSISALTAILLLSWLRRKESPARS